MSASSGGNGTDPSSRTVAGFVMAVFVVATTADVTLQYVTNNATEGTKHAIDPLDLIAKTSLGTVLGMLADGRAAGGHHS